MENVDAMVSLPTGTCEAAKHYENLANQIKLMQFLTVVSREESHRNVTFVGSASKAPSATAFAAKGFANKNSFKKGNENNKNYVKTRPSLNLKSTHCYKVDNTVDRCFDLVEYPPNYKKHGNQYANKCFDDKSVSSSVPSMAHSDTNQHLTVSAKFLINVVDVFNLGLTTGHLDVTKAKIVEIGDLKLNDFLTLFNVLVVPEYNMDLLAVHRLARDSKFFVGFYENKCYIQDLKRNMIVGTGDMNGSLYLIDVACRKFLSNLSLNFYMSKALWHNRLGHTTDQVLQLLKDDLKLDHNNQYVTLCDVCHKAKQTREPYPLSDHKSTQIGLHLDVWGPIRSLANKITSPFLPLLMIIPRLYGYICLKVKMKFLLVLSILSTFF
ncbi:ribonuclease H-like domain-containing protein [Tanacetum coccineum]